MRTFAPVTIKKMADLKKEVGDQIRQTRKAKGLTQKELGEKLGVTEGTASKMENGQNLTLETLERLAEALQIKISVIFA